MKLVTSTIISIILLLLLSLHDSKSAKHKMRDSSANNTQNIRLPSTIRPVHYLLKLWPSLEKPFPFFGYVEIELEVQSPTSRIRLHMDDIKPKNGTIKVQKVGETRNLKLKRYRYDARRHFLTVMLYKRLRSGESYSVIIEFTGTLREDPKGFYRSAYKDSDGNKRWVAATQFWPADARKAFPCFDEPGLKSTFDIFIARKHNHVALSNMPVVRTKPVEDKPGWVWDQFATTVPMSTYLVAFVVTDFPKISSKEDNTTLIRIWTRKNALNQTDRALQVGQEVLSFYEDYFNIAYPLPKLDMIALPKAAFMGMENWGLVTYREFGLLLDPVTSSSAHNKWVSYLVAHELAHQWFGNLVTFTWWNDLWLNEGFATYMGTLAVSAIEPSWGLQDLFVVTIQQDVMSLDGRSSSHPVSAPLDDPARINEVFDDIPYKKGASIIRMMKHFLTEETFKKGLTNYLKHFAYKNTDQDDLWRFLTEVAHDDQSLPQGLSVKTIMDTWTLQEGFPVLCVERKDNHTAILTQRRFYLGMQPNLKNEQDTTSSWWIPITFTSEKSRTFRHTRATTWFRQNEKELTVTGLPPRHNWVIFNLQQTGYYRVHYDDFNWRLLGSQLEDHHVMIHVTNRAQIVDDAFSLARTGLLSYDNALQVTSYLKKEKNYIPWLAASKNFNYIDLMFRRTKDYGMLKEYLISLIEPLYSSLGMREQPGEDLQTRLLRVEIVKWACHFGYKKCVTAAVQYFSSWIKHPDQNNIPSSIASTVYCTAINSGGEEEWYYAWVKYHTASSPDQRDALRSALACTNHIWLLDRYLRASLNPKDSGIRRQEAASIFQASSNHAVGGTVAWDVIRSSWAYIATQADFYFAITTIIETITDSFNDEYRVLELQHFIAQVETIGQVPPALIQSIDKSRINKQWMTKNYDVIIKWLQSKGYSSELEAHDPTAAKIKKKKLRLEAAEKASRRDKAIQTD